MTKQRKQYSKEFKLEMVKPIEEQTQRVVDIAKQICFNGALYAPYALLHTHFCLTHKKMFGEHCLFYGDKILAIINKDDDIFVKVNDKTKAIFEQAGGVPFTYVVKGQPKTMHYYQIPHDALDDRDELVRWFGLGVKALQETA